MAQAGSRSPDAIRRRFSARAEPRFPIRRWAMGKAGGGSRGQGVSHSRNAAERLSPSHGPAGGHQLHSHTGCARNGQLGLLRSRSALDGQAGAGANGYMLESLNGVFVIHRLPPAVEAQPSPSAFSQKKSGAMPLVSPHRVSSKPRTQSGAAMPEKPSAPRISKQQAVGREDVRPPKNLPVGRRPAVLPEDKEWIDLTRKLAQQKEEEKELLERERQLHRQLRKEERTLQAQRKAIEKALREQLVPTKKAAEEKTRLPSVE